MTEHDKTVYIRGLNAATGKPQLNPEDSLYKIIELIPPNISVLDVGCADGTLAQFLKEKNCSVVGIELDSALAALAENYCDQVLQLDLDLVDLSAYFQGRTFDVVLFADVLEHLKNPHNTLLQAKQIISDKGFILASIPNISHGAVRLSLLQGKFQYEKSGLLDSTHLRFFTRLSALELFIDVGYDAEIIATTQRPILGGKSVPLLLKEDVTKELLELVDSAEDAHILQFIIRASILDTPQKMSDLERIAPSTYNPLSTELGRDIIIRSQTLQKLQSELSDSQSELEKTQIEFDQAKFELNELKHTLNELKHALKVVQLEVHDMETTYFWKARTVYKKIEERLASLSRRLGK